MKTDAELERLVAAHLDGRLTAEEGARLHARLQGEPAARADLVSVNGAVSRQRDFAVSLTLAKPAVLCVFYDASEPPPEWLRGRFADSGVRLRLTYAGAPPHPEKLPERIFAVWKSAPVPAGTISLGPHHGTGRLARGLAYAITAKALPSL